MFFFFMVTICNTYTKPKNVLYRGPSKETLRPIWARAAWSMRLALQGHRPTPALAEAAGFKLGRRQSRNTEKLSATFAIVEYRGDWKWHVEQLELWERYWKCAHICHRCEAVRLPRPSHFKNNFCSV